MSYKRELQKQAKEILAQRKKNAENIYSQRHSELCLKFPEIIKLEREMAQTGLDAVKAIGMGAEAKEYIDKISKVNLSVQKRRAEILKENGYEEDYLKVPYTCEKCRDTGVNDGVICTCLKDLVKKLAFEELNKTSPMKLSSFDSFLLHYYPDELDEMTGVNPRKHMADVLSFCKQYADGFSIKSESLLFFGRTGLGKTHLSLAIAGKAVENGYDVIYDTAPNLMSKLEKEHFGKSTYSMDTEEIIFTCELLILDDLGSEFQTAFTNAELYNIINNRLLAGLPTIINTNLDSGEISKKYGERVSSRLIGSYMPIGFCGNDIRQIKSSL